MAWTDDFELASNYTDDTLAQQAASTASTAASEASAAKSDAASAKTTATTAASTASAADTKATQAATAAAQADTKAGNALDTATDAATAAATADSKATEAATTANTAASTATQAKTAATTAQTKADAADTKATAAATDAATAKTTAAGAASTASTAKTTADNAASTAATAKTTANTAKTTADTAKSTADTAKSTATAAAATATEAKETAVEAKETADNTANYFIADSTGAYVASVEGNHDSGNNLKLSNDGLAIRDGVDDLAVFDKDGIEMYAGDKELTIGQTTDDEGNVFLALNSEKIMLNGSERSQVNAVSELSPTSGVVFIKQSKALISSEGTVASILLESSMTAKQGASSSSDKTTRFDIAPGAAGIQNIEGATVHQINLVPKRLATTMYGLGVYFSVSAGFCNITMNGVASQTCGAWTDFTTPTAKTWLTNNAPLVNGNASGVGYNPSTGAYIYFMVGGGFQLWNLNGAINSGNEIQLSITYPVFK